MSNELNSFLFSTSEMTAIFSSQEQLKAMARFEWALTCALEEHGLAEAGSGAALQNLLDASFVDFDALQHDAKKNGNITISFVKQLTARVQAQNKAAARAIHLGATSQDLLDTALVLTIAKALNLIEGALDRLDRAFVRHIQTHAQTIMLGRTWLQPAPPTTFGLKLAGVLAALRRDRARIRAAGECVRVLQFGGAAGTLSALGSAGPSVAVELAHLLELKEPELPWHTQRDRFVEIVQVLAILTGTLAKFAADIALLAQAEVAEVSEGAPGVGGGSSTMPHKQNPVASAAVIAIHTRMPGLASTMLHAMQQEHERGLGLWQAEWDIVPQSFCLASAALAYTLQIAEGLQVDAERMQTNLQSMLGLPMAEAVSVALSAKLGRAAAHELLRAASQRAVEQKRELGAVLNEMPEVAAHLNAAELDRLLDPRNYLGSAPKFIARLLGDANAGR